MKKAASPKPLTKAAPAKTAHADTPKRTAAKAATAKAPKTVKPGASAVKPGPAVKAPADAKEKSRKIKLVRDSFTMPEMEYAALGEVKKACLKAGIEVKKSELLRVGVALVRQMDTEKLKSALQALTPLKAGRPKKDK